MTHVRRFISTIDAGGRLVIVKSDGTSISRDEKLWFDQTITAQLRTDLAMAAKGYIQHAVLYEDTPQGLHPMIEVLKGCAERSDMRLTVMSKLIGKRKTAASEIFRGHVSPFFKDVYALFGMLGYRLMPVPWKHADEVQRMFDEDVLAVRRRRSVESMGDTAEVSDVE